jgi:hypothetical protein
MMWPENQFSPLFKGVREHLQKVNMSMLILFDTRANLESQKICETLAPIAHEFQHELRAFQQLTETHTIRLFNNLAKAKLEDLDDISP